MGELLAEADFLHLPPAPPSPPGHLPDGKATSVYHMG